MTIKHCERVAQREKWNKNKMHARHEKGALGLRGF